MPTVAAAATLCPDVIMTDAPSLQTLYAGETLSLSGLFEGSTINSNLPDATCQFTATFEIDVGSGYVPSGTYPDLTVAGPTGMGTTSSLSFQANLGAFEAGIAAKIQNVSIKVTYTATGGDSAFKVIPINVYPLTELSDLSDDEMTEASDIDAELAGPARTKTVGEIDASRFEDTFSKTKTSDENSNFLIRNADEFAEFTETSRTVAELAEPARTKTAGARHLAAASEDTSSLTMSTEGTQAAQTHAAPGGNSLEPRLDSQATHRRLAVTDVT
jgi:hypothetical protein